MKKIAQLLSIAALATFLYSCSTTKDSAFLKRKYYDFKHGETETALNKPVKHEKKAFTSTTPFITASDYVNPDNEVREESTIETPVFTNTSNKLVKKLIDRKIQKIAVVSVESKKDVALSKINKGFIRQTKSNSESKGSDTQLMYVIIAIFLPPLAIYLYENNTLSSHFWIDLLLTCIFWVPGAVFALLEVLGVIGHG